MPGLLDGPHTNYDMMSLAVTSSAGLVTVHVSGDEGRGEGIEEVCLVQISPEQAVGLASALIKHSRLANNTVVLERSPGKGRCQVCDMELVLTPKRRVIPTHLPPADGFADGYETNCPGANKPPKEV